VRPRTLGSSASRYAVMSGSSGIAMAHFPR
jgi:hypothetical protein